MYLQLGSINLVDNTEFLTLKTFSASSLTHRKPARVTDRVTIHVMVGYVIRKLEGEFRLIPSNLLLLSSTLNVILHQYKLKH